MEERGGAMLVAALHKRGGEEEVVHDASPSDKPRLEWGEEIIDVLLEPFHRDLGCNLGGTIL